MEAGQQADFSGNYMQNFQDGSISKKYPGGFKSITQKGNIFYFDCEETILAVYVLSNRIIRFRYANHKVFEKDFSYAIDPEFSPDPPKNLTHQLEDNHAIISTDLVDLFVNRHTLAIKILDKEGYTITEDEAGFHWEEHREYGGNIVICTKKILGSENFYGLGDKPSGANLRGRRFQMWGSDTYAYDPDTDPLYKNIPFFIGLHHKRAYGIFFDNTFRTYFDMGQERQNVYSFWAQGGEMNYYFFYGPELVEVTRAYTKLTGVPEMPPLWSLGYHQSKWSYYPEKVVKELAATFRKKKIPCDAIHIDIDYMDGYRCFTWDKERFPDPKRMISELKETGFKSIVIIDPGIKIDDQYSVFKSGLEQDVFCKRMDGPYFRGSVWPGKCHFPDYTNPRVRDWWSDLYIDFMKSGIDGVWNDMNEPAVFEEGTFPYDVRHDYDGAPCSHRKGHNIYGMQMHRATTEGFKKGAPEKRPFTLTRSTYSGGQRFGAIWTGDNKASWEHLHIANVQLQRLSICGFSFAGSDIGGFIDHPTPELYVRWLQLGIFHPFYRTHSSGDHGEQEPWSFGEEYEPLIRKTINLRYKLLPYLYTIFHHYVTNATPMIKPICYVDQKDPETYQRMDEFIFGEHLLVCPINSEKSDGRWMYVPTGLWYYFWTSECITGDGEEIWVDAPLDRFPLLIKAGTVLPLYPKMQYVGEKTIESLPLHVYYTHDKLESTLYEDDGISLNYKKGDCNLKTFTTEGEGTKFTIQQSIEGNFKPTYSTYSIRLIGLSFDPASISVDGEKVEFSKEESAVIFTAPVGFKLIDLVG